MQPKTLEEIRQQYPRANYAPRTDCKHCGGTGEKLPHPGYPCICILVDHSFCDEAASMLWSVASKILKELREDK